MRCVRACEFPSARHAAQTELSSVTGGPSDGHPEVLVTSVHFDDSYIRSTVATGGLSLGLEGNMAGVALAELFCFDS
jgi:hypothetical protein